MTQVHTIYRADAWRTMVDGLQQGTTYPDLATAVNAGRVAASELGATHYVHDLDGTVTEQQAYPYRGRPDYDGSLRYSA